MSRVSQAVFISQLMRDLIQLAIVLFKKHNGDVSAARVDLRSIPDYWAGLEEKRAEVDRQMAELKAQGK